MQILRRTFTGFLSLGLLAAMACGARSEDAAQSSSLPAGAQAAPSAPPTPTPAPALTSTPAPGSAAPDSGTPRITVTGSVPGEQPLPKLAPDEFSDCYEQHKTTGADVMDYLTMVSCERELANEQRVVIEKCINREGKTRPAEVVQACTELLERKLFIGSDRFYMYVNRADAYVAQGDRPHALDDYNEAVRLAPHDAKLYFNRAVFYLAESDVGSALKDFEEALRLNPKLVPALVERAKIRRTQNDLTGALSDYSEAIRLEPKTAALWSERGYLYLVEHDYPNAASDEAEAIRLDPKMAKAYLFRGVAVGGLGDAAKSHSDFVTAARLDPSLQRFMTKSADNRP